MRKIAVSFVGPSVRAVARLLTTLTLALLALAGAGYPTLAAKPADVISVTSPNNTLIAQSDDYATQVIGDPWDMNNPEDTSYLDHITPPNYTNGIWSAQTTNQGSFIYLVSQGWSGAMEYVGERNGVNYPISTSRFTHLRFRMYSSVADQAVIWWTTSHSTGTSGNTTFIPTQIGWHVYDVNLLAGGPGSNGSWTAQANWNGLWLSPTFYGGHASAVIQLDWVRLTPATGSTVTINWTATGSSPINLYLATTAGGANEYQIATNLPSSARSYTWNSAGLAPGTYYVHAVMGDGSSYSGPLVVNQAPGFNLTAPSTSSGEDYATTVLGQPWTMTSLAQFPGPGAMNITNFAFGPGYMQGTATNSDPQLWLLFSDAAHAIDTAKYHYYNYRLYLARPSQQVNGQYYQWNAGPRVLWIPTSPNALQTTYTIIAWYDRWLPVALDMRTTPLEPGSNIGWTGSISSFRFDPHEPAATNLEPPFFRVGQMRLTADPTVARGGTTTISWTPLKTNGTITFYYNTARTVGGTLIGTAPLSAGGYIWTVNNLPDNNYWISATANDGLNSFSQVALAPLRVQGSRPCPPTYSDVPSAAPFYSYIVHLTCANVVTGYSDNTFRPNTNATRATLSEWIVKKRGWAIDTTGAPHFADVPASDPAYPYIETAYNHGVLSGYADGTFHPDVLVTRGQMSKMIVNAFGWAINTTGGPHFSDVDAANPFYDRIETIYNRGLVSGYADGTFRWGNSLTRGQLSKILDLAQ